MKRNDINVRIKVEFGGLEVVDAREPLRIQPMECDVHGATVKDPTNCVFARAARRQYGALKVLFWKSTAYVDLVSEDGVRRVHRYLVSAPMYELLAAFDRGEPIEQGRAFILKPPSPVNRLPHLRARARERKKTEKGKLSARASAVRKALTKAKCAVECAEHSLKEAKRKECKEEIQQAAQRRREARARLLKQTEVAVEIEKQILSRKYNLTSPREPTVFDMTVRNGKGKYNFVSVTAA